MMVHFNVRMFESYISLMLNSMNVMITCFSNGVHQLDMHVSVLSIVVRMYRYNSLDSIPILICFILIAINKFYPTSILKLTDASFY